MRDLNIPDWLFSLIAICLAACLSLILRIALPWDYVFSPAGIKFIGTDSYYYMRLVDNLVANFPNLNNFDPYIIYPGGDFITRVPSFFVYMLAGTVRILGGATPDQHTIDTISVFIPTVLGTLTIIPAFFIARVLMNRWAGLVASLLVAIMPSTLLTNTLLGNTDHHSGEIFLASYFCMFFILALQRTQDLTYAQFFKGQSPKEFRNILFSIIAGIFFGIYLITWQGAPIFIFIIFIYLIIQIISDNLRKQSSDYLSTITVTCFIIALLIMLPFNRDRLTFISLAAIILCPLALNIVANVLLNLNARRFWFPVILLCLGLIGGLLLVLILPDVFKSVINNIIYIFAWRTEQNVVGEMKSLFFPGGNFTFEMAWNQYGIVLYTGLAGLLFLVYQSIKKWQPGPLFFAILSMLLLLASFGQIRFTMYASIVLAITTGYMAGFIIYTLLADMSHAPAKSKKHRSISAKSKRIRPANVAWLAVTAIATTGILVPTVSSAVHAAKLPPAVPPDAWVDSLNWLKTNSPEPFGDARSYYSLYSSPATGASYAYPPTMYSVAGWVDYGYWITRIGHRVPVNNPAQWLSGICSFYTAQDRLEADNYMDRWKARYVIIDNRVVSPNDKFYAVVNLIQKNESDYYELCWQKKNDKYEPLLVFYPAYYRSMMIRLYNFDGQQITPSKTLVMGYEERKMPDGQMFKEITALKSFKSYNEANAFINEQKQGSYSIIGTDPLSSPVPLEQLTGYSVAYQSTQKAGIGSTIQVPQVKIFEYTAAHE